MVGSRPAHFPSQLVRNLYTDFGQPQASLFIQRTALGHPVTFNTTPVRGHRRCVGSFTKPTGACMSLNSGRQRSDTASHVIGAPPDTIYQAFSHPASLTQWLLSSGMSGRALEYDFRDGGRYKDRVAIRRWVDIHGVRQDDRPDRYHQGALLAAFVNVAPRFKDRERRKRQARRECMTTRLFRP
jgi:hypothetical protein